MIFHPFNDFADPALMKAERAAKDFCLAMANKYTPAHWLTFCGDSGTGKTLLSKLCVKFFREWLDGFKDERFDPVTEVRYRKGGMKNWGNVVRDMIEGDFSGIRDLREDWIVCLDDIGAEYTRNKDLSISKLYEILNGREGLFTIITANLSLAQIAEQMDTRIASRLIRNGSVVVEVQTTDYNLR